MVAGWVRGIGVGGGPVLLTVLALLALSLLLPAVRRWLGRASRALSGIGAGLGCLTLAVLLFLFGEPLANSTGDAFVWLWARVPGRRFLAPAMLLVALLLTTRAGVIRYFRRVHPPEPPAPGSSTPEAWKAKLVAASPSEQLDLLHANHHSLGLSLRAFLRLLEEVDSLIKEPAQSAYWQRLHEIEEAVRQERTGAELYDPALNSPTRRDLSG